MISLSDLSSVATAIAAVSVTASLIYLAIQTKQNVRHARVLIHRATAARSSSLLLGLMDPEMVSAWIEGNGGGPTPELIRQRQFFYQCGAALISMEDYFSRHEEGLLSDEQFQRGSETFRELLSAPGLRAHWARQRSNMVQVAPRYCAFVDGLSGDGAAVPGDR